jgi:L-threonylcarbamoyladenylate synthase
MIATKNTFTASSSIIARAAEILRRGGLVAFPTETVYGLGADATSDRAIAGVFAAKNRPRFNPLIVHVRNIAQAKSFVSFNSVAEKLAAEFWPGPLTLVLPRKADARVSLLASAGLDTIAVRAPGHSVAQALLAACDLPLAAPSANRSESISPTTAAHVAQELGNAVEMIIDGGPVPLGIESTVIGFENEMPVLLRLGALPRERAEAIVGPFVPPTHSGVRSPGQLKRHYAPRTPLRLDVRKALPGEALLAFGMAEPEGATVVRNLSRNGDLGEAAANLFAMLRELDASGCTSIATMPIPELGLGEAINDRLRRAATPPED